MSGFIQRVLRNAAVFALLWLTIMAFAVLAHAQSVSVPVTATVMNPENAGLTFEQVAELNTPGSDTWLMRQCCRQQSHPRGIVTQECYREGVYKYLTPVTCNALEGVDHE